MQGHPPLPSTHLHSAMPHSLPPSKPPYAPTPFPPHLAGAQALLVAQPHLSAAADGAHLRGAGRAGVGLDRVEVGLRQARLSVQRVQKAAHWRPGAHAAGQLPLARLAAPPMLPCNAAAPLMHAAARPTTHVLVVEEEAAAHGQALLVVRHAVLQHHIQRLEGGRAAHACACWVGRCTATHSWHMGGPRAAPSRPIHLLRSHQTCPASTSTAPEWRGRPAPRPGPSGRPAVVGFAGTCGCMPTGAGVQLVPLARAMLACQAPSGSRPPPPPCRNAAINPRRTCRLAIGMMSTRRMTTARRRGRPSPSSSTDTWKGASVGRASGAGGVGLGGCLHPCQPGASAAA